MTDEALQIKQRLAAINSAEDRYRRARESRYKAEIELRRMIREEHEADLALMEARYRR